MRFGKGDGTSIISSGSQTKQPTCGLHSRPASFKFFACLQSLSLNGIGSRSVCGINGVEVKGSEQFHRCSAGHPGDGHGSFGKPRKIVMPGHNFLKPSCGSERRAEMWIGLSWAFFLPSLSNAHEGRCTQISHEMVS